MSADDFADLQPQPRPRPRSCPTCRSIGAPQRMPGTGLPGEWCTDTWHDDPPPEPPYPGPPRASHVLVASPTVRPADPLVRELADTIRRIEYNYQREGSGPGSRFEGKLLEDVQAEALIRELLIEEGSRYGVNWPLPIMPAGMTVNSLGEPVELLCRDHGVVLATGEISLRTLSFEARWHWREKHG